MAKKVELKERDTNEILYPVTLGENVIMSDSLTLTDKLSEIEEKLNSSDGENNTFEWYEG